MPILHRQLNVSEHPKVQINLTDPGNAGNRVVGEDNNTNISNEANDRMISLKVFATLFNCGCSINSINED